MAERYILENRAPVPCEDLMEWGQWMKDVAKRIVGKTAVSDATVSTVFLGLDHSFGVATPIMFETMIFGGPHSGFQWRHRTYDEAEQFHVKVVACLSSGGNPETLETDPDPLRAE